MYENTQFEPADLIHLMGVIVSAYVSRNHLQAAELPGLIATVHASLNSLSKEPTSEPEGPEKPTAAQIKKSIKPDGIVSFEDGKTYKTLKRHLTKLGLTPETYRAKWSLPVAYPMMSAHYSAHRSELARTQGLGLQRRKRASKAVEAPVAAPEARGRKKVAEPA